jgi:hypothetical protein
MGDARSAHSGCLRNYRRRICKEESLEDIGVDGWIILKWILVK